MGDITMPDSTAPSSTFGASSSSPFVTPPTATDPYTYQTGFGNRFASEAIPNTLPIGRNTPQKCKYELYSEQLNGTSFVSSRASVQHAWFYRIRPSVAHRAMSKINSTPQIEANFTINNPKVSFVPHTLTWAQFPIPSSSESVDFIQGLKTISGHGDPVTKEGLSVHMYTANTSMGKRAFASHDGDMLIMPSQGRLNIQTEMGRMMVAPGEVAVIQAGIRFKVSLPDGPVRGYIQEIFGAHYELPELGPLGSNGMAAPRDFQTPVASFDIDSTSWEIVYKLAGKLYQCQQDHTPFDVVAWHGNYAPYKYDVSRFIPSAVVDKDQSDPSVYIVLMARSKIPGVALTEVMMFPPKWTVNDSFRPPYYHRNVATEIMGLVYGSYAGSSKDLQVGGLSFQSSFMPHGETYETYKEASEMELTPVRTGEGSLAFMFHIGNHCAVTDYALESTGVLIENDPKLWDSVQGGFLNHLEEVNSDLLAAGRKPLGEGEPTW
ncbi:homogentisate 1,2-dioxygenase [Coleophoma cylindrospora]|uniref:homogentisate 1,2-dioxygenase n=1 Tax=Coleophoma cylindrospora TaxID=1849047 RepID=A0A3D8S1R5_9HELO|nr:homogentisate 1,2-dioxygenase [Coleophoma cylindrospora]